MTKQDFVDSWIKLEKWKFTLNYCHNIIKI